MLIQKLRLQRGWSQEQLADVSGLSSRTIQRIEKGQSASLETLKALAAAFGVEVSTLQESPMPSVESAPVTSPQAEEALAFAHVRKLKGFYIHLSQYVVTCAFLFILNRITLPEFDWAIYPAIGWGLGVAVHGLIVFDRVPWLTADWERRAVERRLGRKL